MAALGTKRWILRAFQPCFTSPARAEARDMSFMMGTAGAAYADTTTSNAAPARMTMDVSRFMAFSRSDQFHRHRRRLSTTYAERRDAALAAGSLEGVDERHQDARTARADGVAEGAGAAVHVHLGALQLELGHGGHGHHGEGLVDLEQVHVLHAPARLLEELTDGPHRGGGEPGGVLGVSGVTDDARQRRAFLLLCLARAHQHQRRGAIGDGGGGGSRDRATLFLEGRLQGRDLLDIAAARLLVVVDEVVALAALDRDRHGLLLEQAVGDRVLGALHGFDGEGVLLLAAELVLVGAEFAEVAHHLSVVGVLQSVEEHVIDDVVVAHAVAGARAGEEVGSAGHGFHAARHHDLGGARQDQVMAEHCRLHAGAADLVDGGAGHRLRDVGAEGGLARGRLAEAGRQHAAHDHFADLLALDAGLGERGLDCGGAELGGAHVGELALERTDGGAAGSDDDDGVGHYVAPGKSNRGAYYRRWSGYATVRQFTTKVVNGSNTLISYAKGVTSRSRTRRARRAGGSVLLVYVTDCESDAQRSYARRSSL